MRYIYSLVLTTPINNGILEVTAQRIPKKMKSFDKNIILTLVLCLILMQLCCTFMVRTVLIDNMVELPFLSVATILTVSFALWVSYRDQSVIYLTVTDSLLTVLTICFMMRYDYHLQLSNWQVYFLLLLLILWYSIRSISSAIPLYEKRLSIGITLTGFGLCIWGLLQLYGVIPSNHQQFPMTGPFFNPGPFSGFLSVIFPVALDLFLHTRTKWRYPALLTCILILCILPAGMSRAAWIALITGSLWVIIFHYGWWEKVKSVYRENKRKTFLFALGGIGVLFFIAVLLFHIKTNSAYGRLFIWKNTINAIAEKPLWGYGGGSFPYVYGEAQKEYFSKGLYSQTEEFVAGSPFYAFNEYLHMSVECGIPFLIAYLSLMVYTIYVGMKNKRYGICAGLLSLSVFAFFSYPFQILAFGVMMILLLSACLETRRTDNKMTIALSKRYRCVLLVLLLIGNILICIKLYPATKITEHWILAKVLFKEKRYETLEAENQYLYSYLKHNNEFLMLFAQGLYKQKKYKECILVLHRGQKLSSHPHLRILEGECYRSMGKFEETERCFKDAIYLLPGRIYPYYLLAKLYASPKYLHPEEFEKMKHIVLTKKPKVDSEAIDKMKEEVTKIKVQTIKKQLNYD